MSALDERQLKQIALQEYNIKRERDEARRIKFVPINLPTPPEDHYYTGEQQKQYQREALEYNKKVREYRRELREAWLQVIENRSTIREYETQSRRYIQRLEEIRPQREAFREYIQSIGPPEPTEAQRARQRAGVPQKGLPGPAAGPKPGSLGETLQESTEQGLQTLETPFKAITDPLRQSAQLLTELSQAQLRTTRPFEPSRGFGTEPITPLETGIREEQDPSPLGGAGAYFGSVALDVAGAGVDVATFEVRPGLQKEALTGLVGLGVETVTGADYGYTSSLREAAFGDPFRFAATLVGGGLVGAEIQRFIPRAVGKVRQVSARRRLEALGVSESDLYPFETELGLQYPEPVADSQVTTRLFQRRTLPTERGGYGYYLEIDPIVEKLLKENIPETSDFNTPQITKEIESYYALPFDKDGPAILVRGKAGMKPFAEASTPLPPRSEQIAIQATKKAGKTISPQSNIFKTQIIEDIVSYIPGVDLRSSLLTAPQVNIPNLFPSLATSAALQIGVTQTQRTGLKQTEKELLKQPQLPKALINTVLSVAPIQTPKPIQVQVPSITPIETQTQRQPQLSIPKITQIQQAIQTPAIPTPTVPTQAPPPEPPRITVKPFPRDKKKKKRRRGRRKAVERRVDPLKITFPDVEIKIKVPKI